MIIMERKERERGKRERDRERGEFLRAGEVYERNSEPALGPIFGR